MSSKHTPSHLAFEPSAVLRKTAFRVESVAAWRSRLYVGTANGNLLLYELRGVGANKDYVLVQTIKRFAQDKREVRQLTVVPEWNVLLSLTDSYVTVHDLDSLQRKAVLAKTRYCNTFCVDVSSGVLVVGAKRKLLINFWESGKGEFSADSREYNLPDSAKALLWAGDAVCIGFRREYDLIDIETGPIAGGGVVGPTRTARTVDACELSPRPPARRPACLQA